MASPEGQLIGNGWKIGKKLGSGACGSVHELVAPTNRAKSTSSSSSSSSSSTSWAIKVAPLPASKAAGTGKKRKKTPEERNADLILHEYTTLQNAGSQMRGTMVPEISFMGDPPSYGETADKNFRFLVMERMAAPLSEVVPILHESHGKAGGVAKIPLGDVAVAMFDCIRAMHENGNLFIDVKPENFMLGSASADSSAKRRKKESVSQRVRLIDFGLVERYGDMSASKHRVNDHPNATLIGTPAYASLNIMSGHTASRRDDLEALGYVVSELILMLASSAGEGNSGSAGRRKKKDDNLLPWSNATSDDELKRIKTREMDESKRSSSALFAGLKSAGADTTMANYFSAVQGLAYAETPDYDSIRCYLKKLVVTVDGTKETSRATKKSPARKTSARRKHEDEASDDSVEVIDENTINRKPSGKMQRVSVAKESVARRTTKSASKTREIATQTDEIEVIDEDSVDESDQMDWEAVNATSGNGSNETTDSDAKGKGVLKLCVTQGPHIGHEIPFGGDHPTTVCVGRDPASRAMKDVIKFAISRDENASSVHAKFVINSKSNVHSVRVTDMASTSGTFVNGSCLPNGKSRQAFVGDKIMIGESLFEIRKA